MKTTRFTRILASTLVAGSLAVGIGTALPASASSPPVGGGMIQIDPCVLDPSSCLPPPPSVPPTVPPGGVVPADPCVVAPETCPGMSNPGDPGAPDDPGPTTPTTPTTTTATRPDVVRANPAFTG